jgi:predicted CXXCH cytochrome family protein
MSNLSFLKRFRLIWIYGFLLLILLFYGNKIALSNLYSNGKLNQERIDEANCNACHNSISLLHPSKDSQCSDCHTLHSSGKNKLLRDNVPDLCKKCHEEKSKLVSIHLPFEEGECLGCHSPHGNQKRYFLTKPLPEICFNCHEEIMEQLKKAFIHAPAEDCASCHDAHSSDFQKLLKRNLSTNFYESYTLLKYQLCFDCHERDSLFGKDSQFKKDSINLHKTHVIQKKGRNCLVCHNPHAEEQEHLLNNRINFGSFWYIKLELKKGKEYKTCLPACHQEENYGR